MPFTPSYSVAQSVGSPSVITITDASTGTDAAINKRRVYLQTSIGTYLVPTGTTTDYIAWILSATYKTIDVLDRDYAINVLVQWLDVSNMVLYSKTGLYLFKEVTQQFLLSKTRQQVATSKILDGGNYWTLKSKVHTMLKSATDAVGLGNDIVAAQQCLNLANNIITNQSILF